MLSEIRQDELLDRSVLILPSRRQAADTYRPEPLNQRSRPCPFCPANSDRRAALLTIGPKNGWYAKAIASPQPAFAPTDRDLYGHHELLIETPNHFATLEDLPSTHIERILEAYAHRTMTHSSDPNIRTISISRPSGGHAQSARAHAHAVITASAALSSEIRDRLSRAQAYTDAYDRCAYCDIIQKTQHSDRKVFENDEVIAFTPYASFTNYEIWLMPKRHISSIAALHEQERVSFARLIKAMTRAISALHLPYTFDIDQPLDHAHHLYLRLEPTGTVWAGPKTMGGMTVNAISPEDAASYYRQGLK